MRFRGNGRHHLLTGNDVEPKEVPFGHITHLFEHHQSLLEHLVSKGEVFAHLSEVHVDVLVDNLIHEVVNVTLSGQIENEYPNEITCLVEKSLVATVDDRPGLFLLCGIELHKVVHDKSIELVVRGQFGLFVDQIQHVV